MSKRERGSDGGEDYVGRDSTHAGSLGWNPAQIHLDTEDCAPTEHSQRIRSTASEQCGRMGGQKRF